MYKQTGLIQFNTQPILNDIDNVIKNGLAKLLDEQLNRYELLEKTHKAIMNLPSVVNEINSLPVQQNTHNRADTILLTELSELTETVQNFTDRMIIGIDDKFKEYDHKFDLFSHELFTLKDNINLPNEVSSLPVHTVQQQTQNNIDDTILSLQSLCDKLVNKLNMYDDKFDLLSDELFTLKNNMVELKNVNEVKEYSSVAEAKETENIILEIKDKEDNKTITFHMDEYEKEKEVVKVFKRNLIIESDEEPEDDNIEEEVKPIMEVKLEKEVKPIMEVNLEEEVETEESEEEPTMEESEEEVKPTMEVELEDEVETEKSESEEEEEEDIFEIDIDDVTYCTNNETTGFIYELTDGEMGDKVGYFNNGEPFFYADEK